MHTGVLLGKLKTKAHLEDRDVDSRIILKWYKNRKRMYWTQGKDQWMAHEDGKEPTAPTKG
jgi:hypothetical protein